MGQEIRIGIAGLGKRGMSLLKQVILPQGARVLAVCDAYEDRRKAASALVAATGQPEPEEFSDYYQMLEIPDIDAVVISTGWEMHIPYACAAMKAHKYAAMEVGGAYSVEDCWKLVHTYEETGTECMLMENCCYGRDELMVLNMVRQGIFGEVVHCEGGYRHDLRDEVSFGREDRHYRFQNYLSRNAENYPTHELGPIANVLNIGRGNRMTSLVSMASKSAGLHDYLMRTKGSGYDASHMEFRQGDVVTTLIRCAGGETIAITLDTTLPRYYSRSFHVQGTRAMYVEENHSLFIDGKDNKDDFRWKKNWDNVNQYYEQYDHPVWKQYLKEGVRGDHEGIDWLEFEDFFAAVRDRAPVPINVYDAAAWLSITPLSEQSISLGSAPVAIPDFSCGRWMSRKPWQPYIAKTEQS